ncbi:kiSS-1 receptor-like [Lytechinus variegatus]|uniref:kiSS-1 receptor-like n=1 Tax=Lytechinus variegatus TaxID=7654 RepID=UPI001BB1EEEA|nr:kiSS-1 receptor-like [Lytechinus variegatus]
MNSTAALFVDYEYDGSDFAFENATTVGYYPDIPQYGFMQRAVFWYKRIQIALSAVAIIFISIALLVIAKEKSFHSINNYFIANLLTSDFVIAILSLADVFSSYSLAQCGGIYRYFNYVTYQVSCFTLLLLTLTRYDAIINPLQSVGRWNGYRVSIAITISWLASLTVHVPSYFLVCQPATPMDLANHMYSYTVMFIIPGSILIVCYVRILWRVLNNTFRKKQTVAKQQCALPVRPLQTKLTRMVILILLVFFLLRAPVSTFLLYKYISGWASVGWIRERITLFVFLLLYQSCSAVDPFVYAFSAPQFREYLGEKLRCCRRKPSKHTIQQQLPTAMSQLSDNRV